MSARKLPAILVVLAVIGLILWLDTTRVGREAPRREEEEQAGGPPVVPPSPEPQPGSREPEHPDAPIEEPGSGPAPARVVRGTVRDEDGAVVSGARVLVVSSESVRSAWSLSTTRGQLNFAHPHFPTGAVAKSVSGPDGAFELESDARKSLVVAAVAPGHLAVPCALHPDATSVEVTVRRGAVLTVVLSGPEGTLEEGMCFLIRQDVVYSREDLEDEDSVEMDTRKVPIRIDPLIPGRWVVKASAKQGDVWIRNLDGVEVTLAAGDEEEIVVPLAPPPQVTLATYVVRFLDENGAPLDDRTPWKWRSWNIRWDGDWTSTGVRDTGILRFQAPIGSEVVIHPNAVQSPEQKRTLPAGGGSFEFRLPFRLPERVDYGPADQSVVGRVVDEEGKGLAGALVFVKDKAGKGGKAVTDAEGNFRFEGLHAGRHVLQVGLRDYENFWKRFDAISPERVELELTLLPRKNLVVRIDVPGASMERADVMVLQVGVEEPFTGGVKINTAGEGSAAGLPPGRYALRMSLPVPDGILLNAAGFEIEAEKVTEVTIGTQGTAELRIRSEGEYLPRSIAIAVTDRDGTRIADATLAPTREFTLHYPRNATRLVLGDDTTADWEPIEIPATTGEIILSWKRQ